MAKRTTHRSSSDRKLYAVRDTEGKFKDIQTYKKAHGQDIKRKSKSEKGISQASEKIIGRTAKRFSGAMKHLAKS